MVHVTQNQVIINNKKADEFQQIVDEEFARFLKGPVKNSFRLRRYTIYIPTSSTLVDQWIDLTEILRGGVWIFGKRALEICGPRTGFASLDIHNIYNKNITAHVYLPDVLHLTQEIGKRYESHNLGTFNIEVHF
ncbi:MAG: hypothetical protein HY438_02140 [DPANN group archaeon]|nr:hypothetical protein [DPANN group archaeon]